MGNNKRQRQHKSSTTRFLETRFDGMENKRYAFEDISHSMHNDVQCGFKLARKDTSSCWQADFFGCSTLATPTPDLQIWGCLDFPARDVDVTATSTAYRNCKRVRFCSEVLSVSPGRMQNPTSIVLCQIEKDTRSNVRCLTRKEKQYLFNAREDLFPDYFVCCRSASELDTICGSENGTGKDGNCLQRSSSFRSLRITSLSSND